MRNIMQIHVNLHLSLGLDAIHRVLQLIQSAIENKALIRHTKCRKNACLTAVSKFQA